MDCYKIKNIAKVPIMFSKHYLMFVIVFIRYIKLN